MGCFTDICGDWNDEPETPKGQCTPRRLKNDCGISEVYANEPQTVTIPCPDGTVGEEVSYTVAAGTVSSPFSVAAANATALAQAQAAAEALRAATPCVYVSTEQSCTDTCPEGTIGDPITVVIPAGSFTSTVSQEAADAAALAEACAQVAELRALSPCTEPPPPEEEPGSLWGMGWNFYHNLGTMDDQNKWVPTIVGVEDPAIVWVQISGYETFAVGRKSDGTLWSWGGNFEGELGHGTRSVFPSTAYDAYFPTQIGTDTDWVDFACGNEHVIALKSNGTLWTWGYNWIGELGLGDTTRRLSPTQVGSATDWASVGASEYTSFAIKTDGTMWATGRGNIGQLGNGGSGAISSFEQIGTDTDWATVHGQEDTIAAQKTDGSIWAWGGWPTGPATLLPPVQVGVDTDWVDFSVGISMIAAIKSDGTIWTVGENDSGQLGIGSLTDSSVFVQVGSSTWTEVECGSRHVVALKTDGTMWGWGADSFGALGQGAISTDRQSPVQIGPDDLWTNVFAGSGLDGFSFGLRSVTTAPPPPAGTSGVAFGGLISISGGYHIHSFDYSSTFTVNAGSGVLFDFLLVGAGGGGGGLGGGGCGEVISQTGISLADGAYPVTIGMFTTAGGGGSAGGNGGSSSFNGNTAAGGAGGGSFNDDGSEVGKSAASGGGGGVTATFGPAAAGGTGSAEGNGGTGAFTSDGGITTGGMAGGGGGGSGGNGSNATSSASTGVGGNGGSGTANSITGSSITYAAGGGGGGTTGGGSGGSSAGGNGGDLDGLLEGEAGKTPGSGGGGGAQSSSLPGGVGARGMFVIRYLSPP